MRKLLILNHADTTKHIMGQLGRLFFSLKDMKTKLIHSTYYKLYDFTENIRFNLLSYRGCAP